MVTTKKFKFMWSYGRVSPMTFELSDFTKDEATWLMLGFVIREKWGEYWWLEETT